MPHWYAQTACSLALLLAARASFAADAAPFDPQGPSAQGTPYQSEADGVSLAFPSTWKYAETDDSVVLGSDTEPGLIIVWASDAKESAAVQHEMTSALAGTGARFGALQGIQNATTEAGKVLVAEAAGSDTQGTEMRARLVAVIGKQRTVLIGGLTTPAGKNFSTLRSRVDEIARSVRFMKIDLAAGAGVVQGQWWSYSGASGVTGGGGGSERTMAFCPGGRFVEQSESSYYGSTDTMSWGTAGQGGGGGTWKVQGTARAGRVVVTYPDGSTAEYDYAAKTPNDLSFNGRAYGRVEATLCR